MTRLGAMVGVLAATLAVGAALLAPTSSLGAAEPYQTGDFRGFRNVLPPGTRGLANSSDTALFQCCGAYPPHAIDQLSKYEDLVYATPGLTANQIPDYFKDASFGVVEGEEERVYSPPLRPGVTIVRDAGFGVPHVYGNTRADVMYGAGYVGAEDRLFFMDVLRHLGRAQLSAFAGGAEGNKQLDREQWTNAPYTEDDLQAQIDLALARYGEEGERIRADGEAYIEGINAYILEAQTNPTKMPVEYAAIQKPLENFNLRDIVATASLIGGIFGKGGGGEVGSAQVLTAARARFGHSVGRGVWRDFRRAEDPEAPTTVRDTPFPYELPRGVRADAVAIPDHGSVVGPEGTGSGASEPTSAPAALERLRGLPAFPATQSNALLVSASKSESGRPIAVMGPQVSYFIPEILLEQDLHCVGNCQGGLDIDANGASFPGISPYVLLGRGKDYAWSATSAGQDIIDTFAEELCEPDGSPPTINSMHYRYEGDCLPFEILTRTNQIVPNPVDPSGPETFTLEAQRTVHGIVSRRGTVNGKPVAFARQRSTYYHELDSARAFQDLNSPDRVANAQQFQQAASKIGFTFNWFYTDDRDIAYFNSGDNPERARGVDPNFPAWGTGRWDWQNFDPATRTADFTPPEEHPQVVNQSWMSSWNNKQAPGYRAADDNYSFGSVHRVQSLDRRIEQGLANGGKMNLTELIEAMEEAGTVDLRAAEVLPHMLDVVGTPSDPALASAVSTLRAWVNAGAHRRDSDQDGHYEHERAIEIMDAWWPRAVEAEFKPTLGNELYSAVLNVMGLDNEPNNHGGHVGSAYQSGWYGYVQKDLRTLLGLPVSGGLSRIYCGGGSLAQCRSDLRSALTAALPVPASSLYDEDHSTPATDRVSGCPAEKSDQWCFDSVVFRALGAITVPPIHWINRPTFQQAVEVQGHRPR